MESPSAPEAWSAYILTEFWLQWSMINNFVFLQQNYKTAIMLPFSVVTAEPSKYFISVLQRLNNSTFINSVSSVTINFSYAPEV